ncbi:MAG: J domain-containing protein [Cyclobacteriaceae bacterium]|nr:J domain-containing protein [Cyclobacteriaceae bacterium]
MRDYYQIMGVSPRATEAEIKRSYRKLAVLYHPDKNTSIDAEERFKEINEAYETIGDPEKRQQYDYQLRVHSTFHHAHTSTVDSASRRRRAYRAYREEVQSSRELMAEYLPKMRWACWVSIVVCLLVCLDALLPYNQLQEDILEINRMYRTGRGGGMIYDHDELVTRSGMMIKLYDDEILEFKEVRQIKVEKSILFGKIVTAATPDNQYHVRVASLYSNLSFIPILLFVVSVLGVSIRDKIDFPFNLTIVSFLLLIIVVFLILR